MFLPVLIPVTGNGRVDDLGWCRLFKCTVVKTDCVPDSHTIAMKKPSTGTTHQWINIFSLHIKYKLEEDDD